MFQMIRTVIIEDEDLAADRLERLLGAVAPDVRVAARLNSVARAVAELPALAPDLLLLDIHLADGSGFEIFGRCPVVAPVIFTTAYDQYALAAFKHHSVDYLLKPVDAVELADALHKFRRHFASPLAPAVPDYAALATLAQTPPAAPPQRFLVYTGSRMTSVETSRIACCYVRERTVRLLTLDGHTYPLAYTLDCLEQLLPAEAFFRANRQTLMSIAAVREAHAYSRARVKLFLTPDPGLDVLVPPERLAAFKAWFGG